VYLVGVIVSIHVHVYCCTSAPSLSCSRVHK
jgi:hypothetical protein